MRNRLRAAAAGYILDAAEQVFGEDGLDAKMERIAARAGVAVGTLYNHFADRKTLLSAVLDARRATMLEKATAAMAASEGQPFEARLTAVMACLCDVTPAEANFRRMLFEAGHHPASGRKKETHGLFSPLFQVLFAQARREGSFQAAPRPLHGDLLMAIFRACMSRALEHPEELPIDQVAPTAVHAFLHGLAAGGPR